MKRFGYLAAGTAVALLSVQPAFAGGGNSSAAQRCSQGGYKNLHRADGSSFSNAGQCTSYAAHGGVFQEDSNGGTTRPLTLTSDCTPFDDFIIYNYTFGPGATSGLTSLSYTYTVQNTSNTGETFSGTITSSESSATTVSGSDPNSYVETGGLNESPSGTYSFFIRVEIGHTPGMLMVSDGTHNGSAAVPDGQTVTTFCSEPS